mmetsp:Transcript_15354/g.36259  ORF Transcript_15354/g.36259 Transcript_15354/m.36259 type:complete len:93 (+) Transcript_15354:688-966(+)
MISQIPQVRWPPPALQKLLRPLQVPVFLCQAIPRQHQAQYAQLRLSLHEQPQFQVVHLEAQYEYPGIEVRSTETAGRLLRLLHSTGYPLSQH